MSTSSPPQPPSNDDARSIGEVSFSHNNNSVQQPPAVKATPSTNNATPPTIDATPPPSIPPTNNGSSLNPPIPWSSGICQWYTDWPNCIMTFFCPCITFGQISEIVDRGTTSCAINGAIYALLIAVVGCTCVYSPFYRRRMRFQYNLEGTNCSDFWLHTFCECCALCQEYREIKSRGFDMGLGWHGNVEKQNQEAMTMIPPPHTSMRR